MASPLKLLSKIDKRTKYAVFGWIRNSEHELNLNYVPLRISSLCVLYFREDEIFGITGQNVKVSDDGKSITKINRHCFNNNSYGIIHVSSMSDCVCRWDLKINKLSTIYGVIIGVSSSLCPDQKLLHHRDESSHYAMWNGVFLYDREHLIKERPPWRDIKGRCWKENDKISLVLDLVKEEIRFLVNGVDQGTVYKHVKKADDITYRLMVSMFDIGASVEILNFSRK